MTKATPEKRMRGQYSSLTAEDVRQIRMAREGIVGVRLPHTDPRSYPALAKRYGVSMGALCKIVTRKTWGHVS